MTPGRPVQQHEAGWRDALADVVARHPQRAETGRRTWAATGQFRMYVAT
jgi:hypothetical protein